jgi:endonuclease G
VEFNFEEDAIGRIKKLTSYAIDKSPEAFFTSVPLDCSVLTVVESGEAPPLSSWGALRLAGTGADRGVAVGEHVTIIQHPNGELKKIALTANETVNIFDHRLHYMTDTLPGSSGSPVFNDQWKVVAIHRAGGNVVKNARGERFYANEGVLLQNILAVSELHQRLM